VRAYLCWPPGATCERHRRGAALAKGRAARPGHPPYREPPATARPRSIQQLTGGTRRAALYREPDQWTRLFDDAHSDLYYQQPAIIGITIS